MIHIVFQHADVNLLKEAMKLDESLNGDVVEIKDEVCWSKLLLPFAIHW